jgi:hypothetical protein
MSTQTGVRRDRIREQLSHDEPSVHFASIGIEMAATGSANGPACLQDVANEIRFTADSLDPDTDFEFMRP